MVWCPTEYNIKPMDRMIAKALNIKNALGVKDLLLLNAKTEFTKCVLPGITPSPTEEEKQMGEEVRRKIRTLKMSRKQQQRKKRKTSDHPETSDTSSIAAQGN